MPGSVVKTVNTTNGGCGKDVLRYANTYYILVPRLINHIQLMKEQDSDGKPVAVFHKQRRFFLVLRTSRRPYLEVQPVVMETLDSLIGDLAPLSWYEYWANNVFMAVSFLLMEQRRRTGRKY